MQENLFLISKDKGDLINKFNIQTQIFAQLLNSDEIESK